MTTVFENLVPELLFMIFDSVEEASKKSATTSAFSDILSLSSTSRTLRTLLAPRIFRSINMRNDDESAECCQSFCHGPYANHVKELVFSAHTALPGPYDPKDDPDICDVDGSLPSRAIDVLSNLHRFRSLEKLCVRFTFDEEQWRDLDCMEDYKDEEEEQTLEAETALAWRALLAKTFSAISQNKPGLIKKFEYIHAPLKPSSAWYNDGFKTFLSGLETFTIQICGGADEYGSQIGTAEAYPVFVRQIRLSFFSRLVNVTELTFAATENGRIGGLGDYRVSNPLHTEDFPNLRKLYLKEVIIDRPLLNFVLAHLNTLEEIAMHECHACGFDENMKWHELFSKIASVSPGNLKSWQVTPRLVEIPEAEGYGNEGDLFREPDDALREEANEILEMDMARRVFSYVRINTAYGEYVEDSFEMVESFTASHDQKSWDWLQGIIAENKWKVTSD